MSAKSIQKNTVVIVGAGMAGIKAAVDLTRAGVEVLLLEARDRIGGRTHTVRTDNGGVYDLGASFMHETLINPVFDYSVEIGTDLYYDDSGYAWYDKHGEILPTEKSHRVRDEVQQKAELLYSNDENIPDKSVKDFANSFVKTRPLLSSSQKVNALLMSRFIELWEGRPWSEISTKWSMGPHAGRDAYVRGGYDSVLESLYNAINQSKFTLRKNTEVTKISQRNENDDNVEIMIEDGTKIQCNYAIVTIPLGVLKEEHTNLFQPGLPQNISDAIENSRFGALGKVILEFEEVFWRTDLDRFVVLPDENTDENKAGPWHAPLFFTNGYLSFGKPVLISLMAPPTTQFLESSPDKVLEIYKPALETLRVDKEKPLPRVTKQIVSNWTQDKYARGSYSAAKVGYNTNFQLAFSEGFGNIRFAGEHTALEGVACVHGAFMSGQREAQRVLQDLHERPQDSKL